MKKPQTKPEIQDFKPKEVWKKALLIEPMKVGPQYHEHADSAGPWTDSFKDKPSCKNLQKQINP